MVMCTYCIPLMPNNMNRDDTCLIKRELHKNARLFTTVVDPRRFGTDPDLHHWLTDPDTALFVRGFQVSFAYYYLKVPYLLSVIWEKKAWRSKKNWRIRNKVFLNFFCLMIEGFIRIRTKNGGSGSGRPKNLWIRIHNTASIPPSCLTTN